MLLSNTSLREQVVEVPKQESHSLRGVSKLWGVVSIRALVFFSFMWESKAELKMILKTQIFLDDGWELPAWTLPRVHYVFYHVFCFLILPVSDDFSFCLHSCDQKFSAFDNFPCILECCFSFSLLSGHPRRTPSLILDGTWLLLNARWDPPARTAPGRLFFILFFVF